MFGKIFIYSIVVEKGDTPPVKKYPPTGLLQKLHPQGIQNETPKRCHLTPLRVLRKWPKGKYSHVITQGQAVLKKIKISWKFFHCFQHLPSQESNGMVQDSARSIFWRRGYIKIPCNIEQKHSEWGGTEGLCDPPPITVWNQFFKSPRGIYLRN